MALVHKALLQVENSKAAKEQRDPDWPGLEK